LQPGVTGAASVMFSARPSSSVSFAFVALTMFPNAYSKQLRRKLADGKILDQALAELRSEGASILQCIAAVENVQRCGLAEAKRLVHFSPVWADMREANENFHAELEQIAKESIDESDEPQH
jgi:hypothetical protein